MIAMQSLNPFEVKYRAQPAGVCELTGLVELCQAKQVARRSTYPGESFSS